VRPWAADLEIQEVMGVPSFPKVRQNGYGGNRKFRFNWSQQAKALIERLGDLASTQMDP
jgi:hypothetical protein